MEKKSPYKKLFSEDVKLTLENIVYDPTSDDESESDLFILTIIDNTKNKKFNIIFNWILAFRLSCNKHKKNLKNITKNNSIMGIYTVENSSYLAWFHDQSFNIHTNKKIYHYTIITASDIIHILSPEDPEIYDS